MINLTYMGRINRSDFLWCLIWRFGFNSLGRDEVSREVAAWRTF